MISGNVFGVVITGSNTTGNYVYFNEIGTNASGTIAIGNSFCGVDVYGSSNNIIIYNTVAYSGYYGIINGSATNTYYSNNVYYSGYMDMLSSEPAAARTWPDLDPPHRGEGFFVVRRGHESAVIRNRITGAGR